MKILVVDNYDSFTYNLVQILKELSEGPVDVYRNDEITPDAAGTYDKIVLSPGPGIPDQAGITKHLIRDLALSKSILGVCLGCQAIAEVFGGSLINLKRVYHGVESEIFVTDPGHKLFRDIPPKFIAGRYHSWVVNEDDLPSELKITARDGSGLIMGIAHTRHDICGVQFHPESVMTGCGREIISNWLRL